MRRHIVKSSSLCDFSGSVLPALLARALCRADLALLARCRRPSAFVAVALAGGRSQALAPPLFCASAGGRASWRSVVLGLPDKRTTRSRPPFLRVWCTSCEPRPPAFGGGRSVCGRSLICSALALCLFIVPERSVFRSRPPLGSGAPTLAPQIPFRHGPFALKNSRQVKREFRGDEKRP